MGAVQVSTIAVVEGPAFVYELTRGLMFPMRAIIVYPGLVRVGELEQNFYYILSCVLLLLLYSFLKPLLY